MHLKVMALKLLKVQADPQRDFEKPVEAPCNAPRWLQETVRLWKSILALTCYFGT